MFLDLDEFARALLSKSPSTALISWSKREGLLSLLVRLPLAIRKVSRATKVVRLGGTKLRSIDFENKLRAVLFSPDASKTVLLILDIEPMIFSAGRILNGYRESYSKLRAVVVTVRENRRRDLTVECPDLMDWIGLTIARAEQLGPPLSRKEVNSLIKKLEVRHRMKTREFNAKWASGKVTASDEKWLWREIDALRKQL